MNLNDIIASFPDILGIDPLLAAWFLLGVFSTIAVCLLIIFVVKI